MRIKILLLLVLLSSIIHITLEQTVQPTREPILNGGALNSYIRDGGTRDSWLKIYHNLFGCNFGPIQPDQFTNDVPWATIDQPHPAFVSLNAHIEKLNSTSGSSISTYLPMNLRSIQYVKKVDNATQVTKAYVKFNSNCISIEFTFELVENRWIYQDGVVIFIWESDDLSWVYCTVKRRKSKYNIDFDYDSFHRCPIRREYSCLAKSSDERENIKFRLIIDRILLELDGNKLLKRDEFCPP